MLFDCPHCEAKCQFSILCGPSECTADSSVQQGWMCSNCSGVISTRYVRPQGPNDAIVFPLRKTVPQIKTDKLPEQIRTDYLESLKNYDNSCFISAVIMCRRVIQQSCLDKGATKTNLFDQIEELNIDSNLKLLAHRIRFWGNTGAHPDILLGENVKELDAKIAIDFTEKFLQYVFVIPKEIEEIGGKVQL